MPDQSELDLKYFIDRHVYNCPFCNRRNVAYRVAAKREFDWTDKKTCYAYFVQCDSCEKVSMHLTFSDISLSSLGMYSSGYRFSDDDVDFDSLFFYSVPSSYFVVDENIPALLRELYAEAEGCLKSNFLTGASACARKIVYELARIEGATGSSYEEKLKSLKDLKSDVDPTYFDTLLTIQQVTSDKVHEEAYDNWDSSHLKLILATLLEILNEMYVEPKVRKERRKQIIDLKQEVLGGDAGTEDAGEPHSAETP